MRIYVKSEILSARQQMWISRRSAIFSPVLSTCRAQKRFYTASVRSGRLEYIK